MVCGWLLRGKVIRIGHQHKPQKHQKHGARRTSSPRAYLASRQQAALAKTYRGWALLRRPRAARVVSRAGVGIMKNSV